MGLREFFRSMRGIGGDGIPWPDEAPTTTPAACSDPAPSKTGITQAEAMADVRRQLNRPRR